MSSTPQILRAVQRDELFEKKLKEDISQTLSLCLGLRNWLKLRNVIEPSSRFLYRSLTTLGNLLTLGEENTGIIQWTSNNGLPSKQIRILMVLLDCFGEQFLLSMCNNLENQLEKLPNDNPLRPEAKHILLKCCYYFKSLLPVLIKLHQTIFYYEGKYYNVSKRVTGVQYKLQRFWLKEKAVTPLFTILAIISSLHVAATKYSLLTKISDTPNHGIGKQIKPSAANCALCLNSRTNTSCTPCGHLFCWDCIVVWVLKEPLCPLCRQSVPPSRIVFLRNFNF